MAARRRRVRRPYPRASTSSRGYGAQHQAERERRLAAYQPGDQCNMGGEPLRWWPLAVARRYLDLAHDHANGGYLPGLACRRHNRGAPNRQRSMRRQAVRVRTTPPRW
jgi:hypothetical protein